MGSAAVITYLDTLHADGVQVDRVVSNHPPAEVPGVTWECHDHPWTEFYLLGILVARAIII